MSKLVRFGLVGAGVGGGLAAKALQMLREEGIASIEVVCDTIGKRAEESAREWNAPKHTTNYSEMLASGEVDAVSISTPHYLHFPLALEAIGSGVAVLLDKPLAMNVREADELIARAKAKGIALGVILQNRMSDDAQAAKKAIEAGEMGKLVLGEATVKWYRDKEYYASSWWRGRRATEGGGVLINQAIHTLDLLLWLMGPVVTVSALVGTLHHDIEVEDVAAATIGFESGALGVIQASTVTHPGFPSRLEIHGTEGYALFEADKLRRFAKKGQEQAVAEVTQQAQGSWSRPEAVVPTNHYRLIKDFALAVKDQRAPLVDGAEGRKSVELIEAIYKSSASGVRVSLPLTS